MIAGVVLNSIDKIMISDMVGKAEAGIYGFAYSFGIIVNIIVYAINQTWGPEFFELMNRKKYDNINKKVLYFHNVLLSSTLFIILFAKEFEMIFSKNPDFNGAYRMVPMICYGYVMFYLYSTLSNYAVYEKKTAFLAVVTCTSAGLNVVLNYFGIQTYGYSFATVTTLIAYFFQYVFYYICDKYWFHSVRNYDPYLVIKTLVFFAITYVMFRGIDSLDIHIIFSFCIKVAFAFVILWFLWSDIKRYDKPPHANSY